MYDHQKIEPKWQKYWEENQLFKADNQSDKPKYYILDMFPYPSGTGLHVGHPEGYTATDILSRYLKMKGYNVLHPMGWDAFGLPAENYAIKTKIHPKQTTGESILRFREQIKSIGLAYDWNREIGTADPNYYRFTQWFFLFLYKNGLAYKKKAPVNWCESCKTVLANEQVVSDCCERCKNPVIQKNLSQWFFKITDFIEDTELNGRKTTGLLNGLKTIDWPNGTLTAQKNWIGRQEGINLYYEVEGSDQIIETFTKYPETNYGATFIVIAPEHPIVPKLTKPAQKKEVDQYIDRALHLTPLERKENKEKTGVFTGAFAINKLTGYRMPIWIADFVLADYGTGMVVGVPAHDERDFEFAQKYNLEIIRVIKSKTGDDSPVTDLIQVTAEGTMINSDLINGLDAQLEAKPKIMDYLEEKGWGKRVVFYNLRDWSVSRQRYWGAPIPIIHCVKCGEVPVPEQDLPVKLPEDVDFLPTGESPLKFSKTFHEIICPQCGGNECRREVDTMDTFVCSSWYFFRYADPQNNEVFANKEIIKYWLPVDTYVGGAEHTVMHLLYARFFTKALHRHQYIDFDEPFKKLRHQGIILGEDNEKMSKSRGNVINPDDIITEYGADTLRMYEMFMGEFAQTKPWNMKGIMGCHKFLQRVWRLYESKPIVDEKPNANLIRLIHKSIKKVSRDIESFRFNTAISQTMIFTNTLYKEEKLNQFAFSTLLILLSPVAPHLAEELWNKLGHPESIIKESWPKYDESLAQDEMIELVIQINGKVRDKLEVPTDIVKEDALKQAKGSERIQKYLAEGELVKEIFVPGKLINLVVR